MASQSMDDAAKTTKSPCVECGRQTIHYVRAESRRGESIPVDEAGQHHFSWTQRSDFLECAGCGTTSVRKVYWDDNYSYPDEPEVKLFPPEVRRKRPERFADVDARFRRLFDEVYDGLAAGTVALPVMGARAILDVVIQDRVGDQGSFAAGLDALADKGLISKNDRRILEAAVEAGNATAHRGFFPTEQGAHQVVEIVEHLVSSLYVLSVAATGLKKVTPKRRRRRRRAAKVRATPGRTRKPC